jgi:hypothetical protein
MKCITFFAYVMIVGCPIAQAMEKSSPMGQHSLSTTESQINELFTGIYSGDLQKVISAFHGVANKKALANSYKNGVAALREAANSGNVAIVQALLANGAVADPADSYNITPLMFAALNGDTPAVELLIKSGANVNAQDDSGQSILNYVSFGGGTTQAQKDTITKILLDAGAR